ncbi:MAG TPA: flagellar biosynthesis protein FlhF, partial [Burkholderiales bacterium]|nr:flagellar biosynthesis protein FlhF [Burkholderiales bacterium]
MKVRKYSGATAREALKKVKEDLGPDALILSNRPVAGGVEITALATEDASNLIPDAQEPLIGRPSEMAEIMDEIRTMRSMLEEQLAGFAWGDMARREPVKVSAMRKMLGAGFSPRFSRQMMDKMPPLKSEKEALEWMRMALVRNIGIANPEADIVDRGGVFALVGPTGVGKTTTTAKLAARCVVRHGAGKLALVT